MPDESLPFLFDRFYMVDPSRRGGTGLGLSIAAGHAARMGADLTARSGPGGVGMVFRLAVPVTASLPGGDRRAISPGQVEGEDHVTGGP